MKKICLARKARSIRLKPGGFTLRSSRVDGNDSLVSRLIEGAVEGLKEASASQDAIEIFRVPGAFEISLAALKAAQSGRFDAVICLAVIIRGQTPHFEYIASAAAQGISQAGMQTGVPILFGVITAVTVEQAIERAGAKSANKGYEASKAAVEVVNLYRDRRFEKDEG